MESSNITDYERSLEIKQRQIAETEKSISLKLQQSWQRLQNAGERQEYYQQRAEKSFGEFRGTQIAEREVGSATQKISELKVAIKEQSTEIRSIRAELVKSNSQSERVTQLLKACRAIRRETAEGRLTEELTQVFALKNRNLNESAVNTKDNEAETVGTENVKPLSESDNLLISEIPVSLPAGNNISDSQVNNNSLPSETFYANSQGGDLGKKQEHADREGSNSPDRQGKTECRIEISPDGKEKIDLSLSLSAENNLSASLNSRNAASVMKLEVNQFALLRKLKKHGYADILLRFGVTSV